MFRTIGVGGPVGEALSLKAPFRRGANDRWKRKHRRWCCCFGVQFAAAAAAVEDESVVVVVESTVVKWNGNELVK
ncbi:hypothetical protein QVD17_06700 [Tagetes erecta]|uniref:Uncharacterized protein n=1 Tax=Tagetes erecta TaxID=13708 RepID=A0AAD8PBH3_TARER|nr:hypothetical protein QVD17_06700 [Tagetes erecta]